MDKVDKELSDKYCQRFGYLAANMGFTTGDQVKEALAEQVEDNLAKRPHRLMGRILLDKGWITPQQIEAVLNELFKNEEQEL
ncbi:MAG TPA: hypothetical protein ENH45_01130 [Nitrospirae bacterium]|nr:hypothetical protein BMS3Abin09_00032 [bacterium BMS3Abin09]GBE41908.1 hypothetical protein BMS3Bbin09_01819 [bacterium BMS3Bbin09]HDH34148.1 hypothetical protein [Nitrospirota bacterium]HDZ83797.1 hypothetical protein [Nitrospirota bacterium]